MLSINEELARSQTGHRLELVQILLERGGLERAEESVRLAREETTLRRSGETFYWLARSLCAAGQLAAAVVALEESLRRGEGLPERYRLGADLHRKLQNLASAALFERLMRQK